MESMVLLKAEGSYHSGDIAETKFYNKYEQIAYNSKNS